MYDGRLAPNAQIKRLPSSERPLEKLLVHGVESTEVRDLIAILLHTGTRRHSALGLADLLLTHFGSLDALASAGIEELTELPGIGRAKAARLTAAFALGLRIGRVRATERPVIRTPRDVAALLFDEMCRLEREEFRAVLLDTKHRVVAVCVVSIGHLSGSPVHPRELFKLCIRRSAAGVVLVHNHPSGDPEPSPDDQSLTQRLREAGKLVGIEVLDHVIVGDRTYISLRARDGWESMDGGKGESGDVWAFSYGSRR